MTDFGPALRRMRQSRRMSLDKLAAETGLTKGYIHKLEKGGSDPSLTTLRKLFVCLGPDIALATFGPVRPAGGWAGLAIEAAETCRRIVEERTAALLKAIDSEFGLRS